MAFPDRIAAELFTHEHLQQHVADWFDGRIGQQQLDITATVFHIDAQAHENGSVRRAADGSKARICLETVDRERDGRQRPEGLLGIRQYDLDQALDGVRFNRGVRPPLNAQAACPRRPPSSTSMIE